MGLFPGVTVALSDLAEFDPVEIDITLRPWRSKKNPLCIPQELWAIVLLQEAINGADNFPGISLHAGAILGQKSAVNVNRAVSGFCHCIDRS
jgi:hypothetical protein